MLTALTRKPSPALAGCALEYLDRQEIDVAKAVEQHRQYEACLTRLGVHVISLPPEPGLPDAAFVEDPAIVTAEIAVVTRMGSPERRLEAQSVANALAPFRPLRRLVDPATLEGGDILRAGNVFFAGESTRTNRAGIAQLTSLLRPSGYTVVPVEVGACLHLKTACSYLGNRVIFANRGWIDPAPFHDFDVVDVPPEEPWSANVFTIGDTVLVPASYPRAAAVLERRGYKVLPVDISEFQKAEAGLTCLSILFDTGV